MPSALLAVLGALVYGSADFLGGVAAKHLRSIVVTGVAGVSGLVLLVTLSPLFPARWDATDALWGAVAGVFGMLSVVLLYACLAVGPMSILSPLTAVVSAIAPMLWGLLVVGETLQPVGYGGLALALVAVVLVGFLPGEKIARPSARGLVMAVCAGVSIGAFLIAMDRTSGDSGLVPLVVSRGTTSIVSSAAVVVLVLVALRRGASGRSALAAQGSVIGVTPSGRADLEHASVEHGGREPASVPMRAWVIALACGVADAGANLIMVLALRLGDLSIVSALTALYPAGTILLASVVLRERIAVVQAVGLVLALVAGGMLALG